jgi:outer membrane receptor protein involved in Fe transport
MPRMKWTRSVCAVASLLIFLFAARSAPAQGVTTASMAGVVKDPQGAFIPGVSIVAVHDPSGTTYETVTRSDGRFSIQGMRVGGPYKVTASLQGFRSEEKDGIMLTLGITQDLDFSLAVAAVAETITVSAKSDIIFSSTRTGASTAVQREELGALPTISGRINDVARLAPEYSGSGFGGSFAGQDNRMNNFTVDGSYFNNSFGLAGQPGDRTGVAPISLEAIEQVQVNVAPYDVRQGNFVGGGLNTVTRSGANRFTGSVYHRTRNESYVGKEASGQKFNPGTFDTTNTGEWVGGPIIKDKAFFFESFENQQDTRPLTTYHSNPGGVPPGGNTTRVLATDLNALSSYLAGNFQYQTGPYDDIPKKTPGKPFLIRGDYNLNDSNKITFRYNQLESSTDVSVSSSSSLGFGRQTFSPNFLGFQGSNYSILENIKSGVGEWNSILGAGMSNNLIMGYTKQNESRGQPGTLFPFVDILEGGNTYTSIGTEPFTPANLLYYNTFQAQDSFTKYGAHHSLTFGGAVEKYHSDNSFYFGIQSAYVYNSLADFYADLDGYLADPGRTTSPVTLNKFQVRYSNVPGSINPPYQPLDVWYSSFYGQDEWRPRANVTVTGGVRVDIAKFGDTGFDNPAVDALTFRNRDGSPVQYNTGALPKATPLWSPRVGVNWDVNSDQSLQVRGGTGIFTGKPAYVWISNQIGNTGMLTGFIQDTNTTAYPFNPDPNAYKPEATGQPPSSADVAVTDPDFKFPQVWRTNIAVDRRLPWGLIGTAEYIYNRDVNGMAYINANLPAAQSAYAGPDSRPLWTSNRINNTPGNQVVQNIVLLNQSDGRSWTLSGSVTKPMTRGFSFKAAYRYGRARNTVDPGSIASGSFTNNPIVYDPNNPALGYAATSPGHRFFLATSYTHKYLGWGATTFSAFFDAYTNGNTSYVFSGDMNKDGGSSNDLIYIPRDTSEMNFQTFTSGGNTFTADQQAAAFEAYINQDPYLSKHRGQYAERNALFLPMVKRLDFSVTQQVFGTVSHARHTGEIRLDITNFGNLLNHDWGTSQSVIQNRILTSPGIDANGRATYRLATVNSSSGPALISKTFQTNAGISDVYVMMLSFRYTFN